MDILRYDTDFPTELYQLLVSADPQTTVHEAPYTNAAD
jgi:hypothetical protein